MIASPTVFSRNRQTTDWKGRARECGVDLAALPDHVAIIMDGNGRWAKRHGIPRELGHRRGVEAVRRVVRTAHGIGLPTLSLYSFSSENWKRPPAEVTALLSLLRWFILSDLEDLKVHNVRIRIIGDRAGLESDIADLLEKAETETCANTGLTLVIAFNYGARDELARAAQAIGRRIEAGELAARDVTPDLIASHLDTVSLPDPDLLIRTSGEQRISNFLVWQCAYAEFVFQETLWPDYTGDHLLDALRMYQTRERRFGGRPERPQGSVDPDPVTLRAGAKS